tara:strand:- start:52 stop:339 length:288 start_codon:yes stop_codon:yes gene_type:complete
VEPITLIFLGGMVSGVIVGDAFDPIGLSKDDVDLHKQCVVTTIKDKQYNFEIKDYIETIRTTEVCNTQTKEEKHHAIYDRWKERLQKGTRLGKEK